MSDPPNPPPRRRLVHHERLRRWSPLSKEEGREANLFVDRLLEFPYLTASAVALIIWFYLVQLAFGWPLIVFLPTGESVASQYVMEALGSRMGWLDGAAVMRGEWWRLISATLLHGSVLHIAGNAFVLFFLGRIVENVHGRSAWIAAYVGGGIGGGLLSMWLNGVHSLGASGAILGLLGVIAAFGLRYGDKIPKAFRDSFRLDIWFFVFFVGLLSLLPAVDWAGHLGGFLVGIAVGGLWPAQVFETESGPPISWLRRAVSGVLTAGFIAALAVVGLRIWQTSQWMPARDIRAVAQALEEGDLDRAEAATRRLSTELPHSDPMRLLRVQVLLLAGESDEAFEELEKVAGDDVQMLPLKVAAALDVNRPDIAVDALRTLERVDPRSFERDADGDNALAWALFLAEPTVSSSVDEGLRRVRRTLKGDRNNRAYRNTLAYGLVLDDQSDRALKVVDELLVGRDRGEQVDDVFIKVMALSMLGRMAEAEKLYAAFASEYPAGTLRAEAAQLLRDRGANVP